MNPKHHVSLPIAKQLAEAGIVIKSEYQWYQHPKTGEAHISSGDAVIHLEIEGYVFVSNSPIATEILERLPKYLTDEDDMNWHLNISYDDYNTPYLSYQLNGMEWFSAVTDDTVSDALALLLIRLTKDGLI